jgi:O6-methylguanine-DNA--protein-cysteine methyltransferase
MLVATDGYPPMMGNRRQVCRRLTKERRAFYVAEHVRSNLLALSMSNGTLTGYGGGLERKQVLLQREGSWLIG